MTEPKKQVFTHELKTLPEYFAQVKSGMKRFELRKDDRNVQVGDALKLMEWSPNGGYSGDYLYVHVLFILRDFVGLESGYCVLSISLFENG